MFLPLALFALFSIQSLCAAWNPQRAAEYLDSRQKQWFEWKNAAAHGGPCISCHTGSSYLMARPVLRRILRQTEPTSFEAGLLDALRARLDSSNPFSYKREPLISQGLGVESVHSAIFLSMADPDQTNQTTRKAFDRMWSQQIREGAAKGSWAWLSFNLDPWEVPQSAFYGATLAAFAAGNTPARYRSKPEVAERISALADYLHRDYESQPLHNRVMLLLASSKLPVLMSKATRKKVVEELREKQMNDGGWSLQSFGPWAEHAAAPPSAGSNAYATALIAFSLKQSGSGSGILKRAKEWLKSHQDTDGSWAAESLNKRYEAGSMPSQFMRDAATAFAVLALAD